MNTHGTPDIMVELDGTLGDLLPACVVSTTPPVVPASGLTLAAFATRCYVRAGAYLTYVDQPAVTVSLTGGDGQYWLAVTDDTFSAFSGWTRRAGSHYVWRASATRPADLDNLLTISQITVAGGNITAVSTPWGVAPPLALATADKVSLGGHAPTGVLDVQGSVVSEFANTYMSVRVWPVSPAGGTSVQSIRVEAKTGASSATSGFVGLIVTDQPVSSAQQAALNLLMTAGAQRYNVLAGGTAQNYFGGNVGILNATPTYPLDVTGEARLMGHVGINAVPSTTQRLLICYDKSYQYGITYRQLTNDTGPGWAAHFLNVAGTSIGSITTTAANTAYNTSSDVRLKHSIAPLTGSLDVIAALNPISHRWNADDSYAENFLAHELQRVLAYAVTGEPDAVNDDGSIRPQQVDASKIIPRLVGAVKELLTRVETLEHAFA